MRFHVFVLLVYAVVAYRENDGHQKSSLSVRDIQNEVAQGSAADAGKKSSLGMRQMEHNRVHQASAVATQATQIYIFAVVASLGFFVAIPLGIYFLVKWLFRRFSRDQQANSTETEGVAAPATEAGGVAPSAASPKREGTLEQRAEVS